MGIYSTGVLFADKKDDEEGPGTWRMRRPHIAKIGSEEVTQQNILKNLAFQR